MGNSQDDYEVGEVIEAIGNLPHPDHAQGYMPDETVEVSLGDVLELLEWIRNDPAMDTARNGQSVVNAMGSVADDIEEAVEEE